MPRLKRGWSLNPCSTPRTSASTCSARRTSRFSAWGGWWTLYVLTIHTVWSVAVPIGLVEALVPTRATKPWLGELGMGIAGSLFFVGAAVNSFTTLNQERFLAWPPQLMGTTVVALALIAAAFTVGRHPRLRTDRSPPSPWLVGTTSLLATSGFTLGLYLPGWPTVCVWLTLFVGIASSALLQSYCRTYLQTSLTC